MAREAEEGGMLRQFIPAKLADNPYLTRDDPAYAIACAASVRTTSCARC
jgi:hypothetical protein